LPRGRRGRRGGRRGAAGREVLARWSRRWCWRRAREGEGGAAPRRGGHVTGDGLKFAARALAERNPDRAIRRGSIIRLQPARRALEHRQLPKVEAALVALDPANGAILALAGGFDFNANKFNHATQAWRQPGSSFKPFIYSAALEKGFTPATVLNDAPFVIEAAKTGGQLWEPKNYDSKYEGPMRLRTALAKSKNMVSIRLLQAIGPNYAQDYIQRFGFDPKMHPAYLTMALGAGSATPLQMAAAYSVFANGGYRVKPWFISRVEDNRGPDALRREARDRRRGRRARARRAQRLPHDDAHARRGALRHRGEGDVPRAPGPRRARPAPPTTTSTRGSRASWAARGGVVDRLRHAREPGANETGGRRRCRCGWPTPPRCSRACPRPRSPRLGRGGREHQPVTGLREPSGSSRTTNTSTRSRSRRSARTAPSRATAAARRGSEEPDLLGERMTKSRSRRDNNLRRHIAYLAARLMAEDGIADYATAKQKAARQAGLADARCCPTTARSRSSCASTRGSTRARSSRRACASCARSRCG
jgi:hypothetical protein